MTLFSHRLTGVGLVAIILGMTLLLAGCGQKGPLFLPDDVQSERPAAPESR